jgi:hypothetical protein
VFKTFFFFGGAYSSYYRYGDQKYADGFSFSILFLVHITTILIVRGFRYRLFDT